ncbi:MAG: hypothetical protein N2C14_04025 [Planctomycetales bacterium]
MSDRETIEDLMIRADDLPCGEAQVNLLEEAQKLADATHDLDLMFEVRMELVDAAIFGGRAETALAAFSWCLGEFDRETERFDYYLSSLMWRFKNVLLELTNFTQIPLEQLGEMLDEFEKRFQTYGYSMRTPYYLRCLVAMGVGRREDAEEHYEQWQRHPRDEMSHCHACELDSQVDYLLFLGRSEQAAQAAEPILQGEESCGEIPHRTLALMLRPLTLLGREEEAAEHQSHGYRIIKDNPEFLPQIAEHLAFLLSQEQLPAAVAMFERHLSWALKSSNANGRFLFHAAAGALMEKLAADGDQPRKMRLPERFPLRDPSESYQPSQLAAWFAEQSQKLASLFDARNRNDFYSRELAAELRY